MLAPRTTRTRVSRMPDDRWRNRRSAGEPRDRMADDGGMFIIESRPARAGREPPPSRPIMGLGSRLSAAIILLVAMMPTMAAGQGARRDVAPPVTRVPES